MIDLISNSNNNNNNDDNNDNDNDNDNNLAPWPSRIRWPLRYHVQVNRPRTSSWSQHHTDDEEHAQYDEV